MYNKIIYVFRMYKQLSDDSADTVNVKNMNLYVHIFSEIGRVVTGLSPLSCTGVHIIHCTLYSV